MSFSPSSLAAFSTTTASATDEPSLLNTEAVALGGSLAKLPVRQISTISGVAMWPTVRAGRLVNKVAVGCTPSRASLSPSSLPPLALSTISAVEYRRLVGTPIVLGPAHSRRRSRLRRRGRLGLGNGGSGGQDQGGSEKAARLLCVH